jgi:diguanylate cyclase (GGDEF)-like protein
MAPESHNPGEPAEAAEFHRRFSENQDSTTHVFRKLSDTCSSFMYCGIPFALIILDMDHLKTYNDGRDELKHKRLLSQFITMLKTFRQQGDILCNAGADRAYALILQARQLKDFATIVEAIRNEFLAQFHQDPVGLTISLGGVRFPGSPLAPQELISEAYRALYTAKTQGGNCVVWGSPDPPQPPPGKGSAVPAPLFPPVLSAGCEQAMPENEEF